MTTMTVKNAGGLPTTIELPLAPGRAGENLSRPVVLSSEDSAAIGALASEATAEQVLLALQSGPTITYEESTIVFDDATGLSDPVDCSAGRLSRIDMPAEWTAAPLTFQVSENNVQFYNLYDKTGTEYSVTVAANRAVLLPLDDFRGVQYLKIRSGPSAVPVVQTTTSRVLKLVLVA